MSSTLQDQSASQHAGHGATNVPRTANASNPQLIQSLNELLGQTSVLVSPDELLVYECDGYIVEKTMPDIVVFPTTTEQVVQIVKICNQYDVPFVPRGAGTSLAGGTLAVGGGVMISLTRMREIIEVSLRDRYALVQPGAVNVHLTNRLKGTGFHYAPDPSSQGACTIDGNVATNAGGPHTLKYGVTVNHILGVEVVLPDGTVATFGGPCQQPNSLDLHGLFVGSEGTFGICTKVWVKLTRDPVAYRTMLGVFPTVEQATHAISGIVAAGIIPAALELLDQGIIGAVEQAFHFGFPLDAGAVLIIESDGLEAGIDLEAQRIVDLCMHHGATEVRTAQNAEERAKLWKCRKQAFGAIGRLAPSFCTQDGVVPRTKLPQILEFIQQTEKKHNLRIVNVFHAGDGNIHPILLFDERDPEQTRRVIEAGDDILMKCIELGGSVTGEHGIGVEKISFMDKLFTETDLEVMRDIRRVFNPEGRCSPHKILPTSAGCANEHIPRKKPGRRAAM